MLYFYGSPIITDHSLLLKQMTSSWQERTYFFERITQEFDTLFEYTTQEGSKLKLHNIDIIQIKYGISIDQTYHIMKIIIQEYWGTKTNDELKFQQSPFPVDTSFENELFVDTPIIGEELKQIKKSLGVSLNH